VEKLFDLGKEVLRKLNSLGYVAYFVGGFVRDRLLGIETLDIDITTNALPEEIEKIFEKTKATGLKYGTVTVYIAGESFEVTTFRVDQLYLNHRKPEKVVFSKKLEEDLKRRDFTINAFAMDIDEKIYDYFNGLDDLKKKIIRAIGDPSLRFKEDALRIMRAIRFVSKLGFEIEEKTLDSMRYNVNLLGKIANERIVQEMKKIFNNPCDKEATFYLEKIDIDQVFPEFKKALKIYNSSEKTLDFLQFFALALYLSDQEIPDYWRFSNKEKAVINKYIELVEVTKNDYFNPMIIYRLGKEISLKANQVSQVIDKNNDQEKLINAIYDNLPIHKTCELKFKGQDILELTDIKNAEIIGEIIDELEYQVINKQIENDYEQLKAVADRLMENLDG
jgi:tRNA nucleotidyltransferase (CCA-adding enzyme)